MNARPCRAHRIAKVRSAAAVAVSAAATFILFGLIGLIREGAASASSPEILIRRVDVAAPKKEEERRMPPRPQTEAERKPRREPERRKISARITENKGAAPKRSADPMRRFLVRADLASPIRSEGLDLADVAVSVPDSAEGFGGGGAETESATLGGEARGDASGREADRFPSLAADRSPVRTFYVEPIYPEAARRMGVEGWVEVEFTVGPDGRVSDARVVRSSGGGRLDDAAIAAVRRWLFRPALRDGKPVPATCYVKVVFRLVEDR